MKFIRAYLRASTEDQNAERAKIELQEFAKSKGFRIAHNYIENISGTKVERPELNKLIADSEAGDILLVEKIDRLSRLPYEQWKELRAKLEAAQIRIMVADQPMTHSALSDDEQQGFITKLLTDFMLDLAAGMARDDYETRRKRQAQGIEKAKEEGKFKGKQINKELHERIKKLLIAGNSFSKVQEKAQCSRGTVAKVSKQLKEEGLLPAK